MANTFIDLKRQFFVAALAGVTLSTAGCNSSWTDPFASRPVGQKFSVPPNPDNQFPMSLSAETLVTRATVVKLSRISDMTSSRDVLSSVGAGERIAFKSIALIGKHQYKDIYTMDRIQRLNQSDECKGIQSDIRDMLKIYSGLTLVCGEEFTRSFREALTVIVTTEDGKYYEFTSWGSQWSDVGGYRVVIQSMEL